RSDADNPAAGWNYLFIPYGAGDVDAGSAESGFGGRTQIGYGNVARAATMAAAELPGLAQVLLIGQSAGGFGATVNLDQVATIFGDVPVDLVDDSGPPLSTTYLTPCFQDMIREEWNLDAAIPADCDECTTENGG